jgi:cytochrome c biogenesis protein CcdA
VLKLVVLLTGIALADSVNPATIGPALYFATTEHPVRRVVEFTAGFFIVNFLAGVLIVLGPGQLLVNLANRPGPELRHIIELIAGVILIGVAIGLFLGRTRLAGGEVSSRELRSRHSWTLGAGLAAAELPTAFPYFAALAAVIGSGLGVPRQLALVFLFNFFFIAPELVIIAGVAFGGEPAQRWLRRAGDWLRLHWPLVFAWIALIAGLALAGFGLVWLLEN